MPSYNMHLAFAKIIDNKLQINNNDFYIGALAADVCEKEFYTKRKTHFGDKQIKVHLDKFLNEYGDKLDNPYVLGYLVHIYLDYMFFERFLPHYYEIVQGQNYSDLDSVLRDRKTGEIKTAKEVFGKRFYDNYNCINEQLVQKYNIPNKFDISKEDIQKYSIIQEYDYNNLLNINNELNRFVNCKHSDSDVIYTFQEFDDFINKCANDFINTYCNNLINN